VHWATVIHFKNDALILTKNGLGYTLGDFFTNSSGHPVGKRISWKGGPIFSEERLSVTLIPF
jgi:hypothetical protein